jgi:radical SAM superfamily enzyme YgiQ (UPF0313 family)
MRLLLFYPTHFSTGMKPIGLSTLKAYLQKNGHEVRIFDFAQYAIKRHSDSSSKTTEVNIFKPVPDSEKHLLKQKTVNKNEFINILLNEIQNFRPDILGVSLLTNNLIISKEYFSTIKEKTGLPIIVGGIHPTVAPEKTISYPWLDMICIGYGEAPLLKLLNSKLKNLSIPNIWFKENGKVIKNDLLPHEFDFKNYEFPNWDDYSDNLFYKPFQGKVMRYGDVEFGRGCPFSCTFCVVSYLRGFLNIKSYAKKPAERMIEELVYLKNKYKIEIFRFWDELFLLVNDKQLLEFGWMYKKFVDLPFIIETTAESISPERAKALKEMGCVSVSIGVETGNYHLRSHVLNKKTTNETFIDKFNMVNENKINTTAYNMIGLPGETEEMIMETIDLNRKCQVKTPSHALFYPYPGTKLREYCVNKGYLDPEFEDDNVEEEVLYTRSVLKQDNIIKPEILKHYIESFPIYCKVPSHMHSNVLRSLVNDKIGQKIRRELKDFIQQQFD